MEVILNTYGFEACACGGVELCAFTAELHIDIVHIAHQIQCLLFADVLIKGTAKIVGNIIFSVRESTGTAKSAHNAAAFASDAGFDFFAVNGAVPFFQGVPGFKNSNLQFRLVLHQLIGGIDSAGAGTDNDDIIVHRVPPVSIASVLLYRKYGEIQTKNIGNYPMRSNSHFQFKTRRTA